MMNKLSRRLVEYTYDEDTLASVNLQPLAELKRKCVVGETLTQDERRIYELYDHWLYGNTITAGSCKRLADYCLLHSEAPVPDESVVTNESGGSQSYVGTRYDLLPTSALDSVAQTLHNGSVKYGDWNWLLIPTADHLNHAVRHIYRYLATPNTEDLSHAATRLLFALTTHIGGTSK